MKVLWVTNSIFPDLTDVLGMPTPVVGGWMYGLANLLSQNNISLTIATARSNVQSYTGIINDKSYYLLKGQKLITKYDRTLEPQWKKIIQEVDPDLVHIHGTEYAHGLALIKACPRLRYVISIQGLVSICARYYLGQISPKEIRRNRTFRDFIKNDGLLDAQKKIALRGEEIEKQYFQLAHNFIGRTQWDHDHTSILNPDGIYHFCNESLRDGFYTSRKWNLNNSNPHSIFLTQANYPLKGAHQVLKAVRYLISDFPDLTIRIAGGNIIKSDSLIDKLKIDGYGKYILRLIQQFNLQDHIRFIGPMDEQGMIREYLNCNVFICPSSIENSPNSLGEAQLLGVPSIGAYVGGVPDMICHGKTGLLYRFEEVEMLAEKIRTLFTDKVLAEKLSQEGVKVASKRHDRNKNLQRTLEIYKSILST